jgi:hypothetical protein
MTTIEIIDTVRSNAYEEASRLRCCRGETTYAIGWLKWGPNWMLEDSGEGDELKSTTERTTDLPRFGALVRR